MEVSRVELIEEDNPIFGPDKIPKTFFTLSTSEQKLYDSFRSHHDNLKKTLDGLKAKGLDSVGSGERKKGEQESQEMFLELVKPYFQNQRLEIDRCFTTYGNNPRRTFLTMPGYLLFKDNRPFNSALKFDYWFSTEDENLSCKSDLCYRERNNDSSEGYVLYNLLEKIIEGKQQDGINFPIISRRGDSIYFASTEFAVPMMSFIINILKIVGPGAMKELKILYRECANQRSRGEFSDTKLHQKFFEKAYENELEKALRIYEFQQSLSNPIGASERIM